MKGSLVFEIARSTPWILIGGKQVLSGSVAMLDEPQGIFTYSQWILL